MKVLYIEDDYIDQVAVTRMLKQRHLPYQFVNVDTVAQALKLLEEHHFDIILCDYLLGSENAFDVLNSVTRIPVIVITGYGSEDVAVRVMKAGAYDYIVKDSQEAYLKILPMVLENTFKRKMTEIQAHTAQQEIIRREILHQFVQDVSHDLRTRLTALKMSLYLQDQYITKLAQLLADVPADIQHNMQSIIKRVKATTYHSDNLESLILDMLEMVKLDTVSTLHIEPCDLNIVMAEMITTYQQEATKLQLVLVYQPPVKPLLFSTDVYKFRTIVHHLVKNALNYTPAPGSVTVYIDDKDDHIILVVSDTGIGIALEEFDKIFQRFYRSNKDRTLDQGNSGLGLAIVKQIVELLNGNIEIISEVGKGSTFRVYLPGLDQQ